MLIERTFEIGGILVAATGALLLAASVWTGLDSALIGFIEAGGILVGFGVFFWFVGRDARKERLRLLALGESGGNAGSGSPRTR